MIDDELRRQIDDLTSVHKGLVSVEEHGAEIVVSGALPFEASVDEMETITETFDIELVIPRDFPDALPEVKESSGRIGKDYEHRNADGTLCLAVPVEQRRVFLEQPTLLGFVNGLVIPYLYGHCFWRKYGYHPFDEAEHGYEGIVRHYLGLLDLSDEIAVLAVVCFLFEYGYRGHHNCPCGSGLTVRACHGSSLRALNEQHTRQTIAVDFLAVLDVCFGKYQAGELSFPVTLQRQVRRLLKKIKT